MKTIRIVTLGAIAAAAAALLAFPTGCRSEVVESDKLMPALPPQAAYKPVPNCRLKLEMVSNPILTVGEGGQITYSLENVGDSPVEIKEWHLHDVSNLNIYCQPWLPGNDEPDPALWLPVGAPVKEPSPRYPVFLNPRNRITIACRLPFVDKLAISANRERRYFIKADLNLTSVTAVSPATAVIVRPAVGIPAKKKAK